MWGPPKAKSILLGVQGCRLPAFTQFKRYPKARSIASSRRSSLPFTTFLFHNAVLDRKLLPTDPSMVYLPCLHVTGHIPFASGANVNIRFLLHNAVPHRKLVPTDRSMVYLPCLDITGHSLPSGANVNICLHNAVLDWKLVPTDRSMVYFPCLDVTGHIPFASGANVNIRFSCTTPSFTENWFPQTVRWSIFPVLTSLATFPLQAGQM